MADIPRISLDYSIHDQSFNFSPSGEGESSKIVLYCFNPETKDYIPKERYISKYTKTEEEIFSLKQKNLKTDSEVRLIKTPIEEILLEIKKEEEQLLKIGNENLNMEVEFHSNLEKSGDTLVKKYTPKKFLDLLGNDQPNRFLLKWLKSWQYEIFKKKSYRRERKINDKSNFFFNTKSLDSESLKDKLIKKNTFYSNKYKIEKMMESLELDVKEDCDKLKNMIPLISGPSGSGKTSLAVVVAKHCGYNPVVVSDFFLYFFKVNLSSIKNYDDLLLRIKTIGNSHTLDENLQNNMNFSSKPVCLILDEIDNFFDTNKNSMQNLLNFFFEKRKVTDEDYEENPQKKKFKFKRPIIFICEDMYLRGLRPLRMKALAIQLSKDKENVIKKIKEIGEKEVKN